MVRYSITTHCSLIVFGASLFGVFSSADAAFIGLSISNSLTLNNSLVWLIRMSVDVESYFTSVERVLEYVEKVPQESTITVENSELASTTGATATSSSSWPSNGSIDIDNLWIKYRDDLDHVLKGVTCSIKSGEKIGIVGRTGSGKSTLVSALFRLIEANQGSISIDKVNIASIELSKLRSSITIIPQVTIFVANKYIIIIIIGSCCIRWCY